MGGKGSTGESEVQVEEEGGKEGGVEEEGEEGQGK